VTIPRFADTLPAMRQGAWQMVLAAVLAIGSATGAWAQDAAVPDGAAALTPADAKTLGALDGAPMLASDLGDEAVYATPPPPREEEGVNSGGAHFDINIAYVNRYVYRGVNDDSVAHNAKSLNLVFEGRLEFDLGQYPHPFVGLLTNIYDSDPVSRFQEIRPYAGLDWNLRPFRLEAWDVEYIYPQREQFNLPEVDAKITLDDSLLFHTEEPIFSPYILGAYDYHKNPGTYLEMGIKHDFPFEDLGLTITPQAAVAWISGLEQQFVFINTVKSTGWQHFEVGMTVTYSLNQLLNVSSRFGEFDVKGYLFYDDALNRKITASNVIWGGVGVGFKY
jgi:hypothetical protein